MSPAIWITGAGGLIGKQLVPSVSAQFPEHRVVALTRALLDLGDYAAVERRFREDRPSRVFHCAAVSRSPVCQAQPQFAREMNVEVTRTLTALCVDAQLIFFSTDLVFDGAKGDYREDDPVNPLMVYGETKVEAESIVRQGRQHLIVRTSLNFGFSETHDRSFNEELMMAWRAGRTLRLFTDEFRCPIAAQETARAVVSLAATEAKGVFHVAGSERLSRWDMGRLLAARYPELNPQLVPGSQRDYAGARRPPDVSLNCARSEAVLGRRLPKFSDWLRDHPPGADESQAFRNPPLTVAVTA